MAGGATASSEGVLLPGDRVPIAGEAEESSTSR